MKNFNRWLNSITILIIVIAMGYFDLAWLKHNRNLNNNFNGFLITASILFTVIIIGIIISKKGRKK